MNSEVKKRLTHIDESIRIIETYLADVPASTSLKNDMMTSDAIHRRLSIIGTASAKADKLDKELNISNKDKIMSLSHVILQEHDLNSDNEIWIICKKHLPVLKSEVEALLNC